MQSPRTRQGPQTRERQKVGEHLSYCLTHSMKPLTFERTEHFKKYLIPQYLLNISKIILEATLFNVYLKI